MLFQKAHNKAKVYKYAIIGDFIIYKENRERDNYLGHNNSKEYAFLIKQNIPLLNWEIIIKINININYRLVESLTDGNEDAFINKKY